MNKIYLLLGSNMGDSKKVLAFAQTQISGKIGAVIRESKLYRTAAWGNSDQPDFINQVLVVASTIDATTCMKTILNIEHEMGRRRTTKNAPRIIDIDILYFNKDVVNIENLVIPHPALQNRLFVLVPLNELAPKFIHPVLKKSNHQLLKECKDTLNVKKI